MPISKAARKLLSSKRSPSKTCGDDGKQKPVLYFRGKVKGFVLNATNYDAIADAYGDETDDWSGQPVELYPTKVPFKGS